MYCLVIMTTIITTNGDTQLLQSETKTELIINNNSDIQSIVKLAPSILDVYIENNANLISIQLNNRGLRNLHIINNPMLASIQAVPITKSVIIKDNPLIDSNDYDALTKKIMEFPTTAEYTPYIEINELSRVYQRSSYLHSKYKRMYEIALGETIAYNIKMDSGTARKSLKHQNKTHKNMKTKDKCQFVFKKTSFGMPIMYRVYN